MQGTNTTLGMFGAGNSSASGMADFAAGELQKKNSGDINDQYNEQSGDILNSRAQYKQKYNDDFAKLNQEYKTKQNEVKTARENERNDYRAKIANNTQDTAMAQSLASGISNWTPSAGQSLKKIDPYKASGVAGADVSGDNATVDRTIANPTQYYSPINGNEKKKDNLGL